MAGKNVSGTPISIRESLKKATTEMLVLFLLKQKPMYTYEMMATIEQLSSGDIQFNTLYQAIYRLQGFRYIEESDKVLSDANRVRIYFSITDSGREYLSQLEAEYKFTVSAVDRVLSLDGKIAGEADDE